MTSLIPLYPNLVKEFIVNIHRDFNKVGSIDYTKVHVRESCIYFSHVIINKYLGKSKHIMTGEVLPLKIISQEITSSVYEDWSHKGLLPTASLSVKYTILTRIGVSNWVPINHSLGITPSLARLVYQIGTRVTFDFGEHVFDQILKQTKSFAKKLPISFTSLISGVLINQ